MSQIRIIKQDVLNSLKHNLSENNIFDLLQELKEKSNLNFEYEVMNKSYMCFVANISLVTLSIKNYSGFGRNEYEALKTALFNLIEDLLQDEKFINPVKESLKIFLRNMKEPSTDNNKLGGGKLNLTAKEKINNNICETKNVDNCVEEDKANLISDLNGFFVVNENSFNIIPGKRENNFNTLNSAKIKEILKEKDLIILELEKLILDIMNYNKKIVEMFETESNIDSMPNYFKCPISWEKMENPVVTMEGHSYEKWAIEKWLYTKQTSPITGLVLNDHTLISNYTLKSALDDFHKKQIKSKKYKVELQKFLTKCEYDLNDLKKYFNRDNVEIF